LFLAGTKHEGKIKKNSSSEIETVSAEASKEQVQKQSEDGRRVLRQRKVLRSFVQAGAFDRAVEASGNPKGASLLQ
jgi:hypothetical protein